ncbi:hypothetical protein I4U23_010455 [Adineta vaga]|nr:hypothetical protein I4U23_010455 [Adineta vaga]
MSENKLSVISNVDSITSYIKGGRQVFYFIFILLHCVMTQNDVKEAKTSFYLHSKTNRRLYPPNKYPLTHLLDYQTVAKRWSKQLVYVKHFKYTFILLLLFILFSTIFFQLHIYAYNSFFGPFHLNLNDFTKYVENYKNGQSWFKRIEYIQVELGENNIRNPLNAYETIRRYSDPITRRHYVGTYKKVKTPPIYVKLPTRVRKHFHLRHPFDFSLYSIRTLKCIVKKLQSESERTYQTWIEKSEYIKYINEEYSKNATRFNMLALSKCGILIGYLYCPMYEKAFLPTKEYPFYKTDIAFDMTRQYYPFYSLVIVTLIFLWLLLKTLFYFILYLINIIYVKICYKYGLLAVPLVLSEDVLEELWLLNNDDSPHEQLLQLDEMIQNSQYELEKQLFIIKNSSEQLFVVLLRVNLQQNQCLEDNLSPFIICPVTDIIKIVGDAGICYGVDASWIPWTPIMGIEISQSQWLHDNLMVISEHYREQYEYRREHEYEVINQFMRSCSTGRQRTGRKTESEAKFERFLHHEQTLQNIERERQSYYDRMVSPFLPATPKFIAEFRIKEKTLVDATMENENYICVICQEPLRLDDSYEIWPCPSPIAHIFHYDCMLDHLRNKHTCPMCRHEVDAAAPIEDHGLLQFLRRIMV